MRWSPRRSLVGLALLAAAAAAGCADSAGQSLTPGAPAATSGASPAAIPAAVPAAMSGSPVRGTLVNYIFTMDDGRTDEQFFLRLPGATEEEVRLQFASPPDVAGGTEIEVHPRAVTVSGEIVVDRMRVLEERNPIEARQLSLIKGQAYRPRRIAMVLVDLGGGVNITKDMALTRLNGIATGNRSLRQYYMEASYGRQDLQGDVIGPLRGTMAGCNFSALASQLRGQVPGQYDHYFWYFGSRQAQCGFLGVAVSGFPDRPSRDTWYNASADCVVLVQEPGHNFGMMHSSSMRCRQGGAASIFNDVPQGNCTHSEYGDTYDPMGRACRHMNAYQKAFQGWFGGCNVVEVKSSGTFTINPLELPCDGAQVLQIPMPKSRPFSRSGGGGPSGVTTLTHYYVELRSSHGFDSGLPPQVQIRASGDIRMRTQRGFHTWFLDQNPATTALDGLTAGGSYTDPAGSIKITVESVDATKATVKVDITGGSGGGPICMDGTAFTAPGPGAESCAPGPAVPAGAAPTFPDGGTPPVGMDAGPARDAVGGDVMAARDTAPASDVMGTGGSGGIDDPRPTGGTGGSSTGTGGAGGAAATGGTGGRGGSGGGQAGSSGPSAAGGSTQPPPVVSGCSCRVGDPGAGGTAGPIALVLGLGAVLGLRRRRRR